LTLRPDDTIIPDDTTTLFVCSGMQRVRDRFLAPDGSRHASLQSCIRTNDLGLVGDGLHLTFFQMLGNFHFGGDYEASVELWHSLLTDLHFQVDSVHHHPDKPDHKEMWVRRGYDTQEDSSCVWTDGNIGGYCCEVYSHGLEIGNLVNTLGHSVDVGFGWERMVQIDEGCSRVDQTTLFGKHHPVVADHARTVEVLWRHNIEPGSKHRNYICRRLIRRMLPYLSGTERFVFHSWVESEKEQLRKRLVEARRLWRRHGTKPPEWWWTTCGILPEELVSLQQGSLLI
jgi:alanyl-tRNA synthetase